TSPHPDLPTFPTRRSSDLERVQPVIQRLAALKKLLRRERDEHRRRRGGQPALNLDLIQANRERGHQPFFLLEVQPLERTVVFLRSEEHTSELQSRFDLVCR